LRHYETLPFSPAKSAGVCSVYIKDNRQQVNFDQTGRFDGGAWVKQRTAEPQNNEPQNFEGWNRCALSFKSIKIDRIPSFDIRYSIFIIDTCPPCMVKKRKK
jgi:hypothetical protein